MRTLTAILATATLVTLTAAAAMAQPKPEFKLGFKALADQLPSVVGEPLENEQWGANGDSLQQTTTGLMVWRKVDNWTAFTDGSRTWINGPNGVQERGNNERFDWEAVELPVKYSGAPTIGAHLGPDGPLLVRSVAVSPDWPRQRLLVASRQQRLAETLEPVSDLVRSRDAGTTWEWLEAPSRDLLWLTLARSSEDHPILFGLAAEGLYRSTDLGTSWQRVHQRQYMPGDKLVWQNVGTISPTLVLSPNFESDGLALLVIDGHLYRGTQRGAVWEEVVPAPDQRIAQLLFSPDFAHDQTIFLTAVTSGFPNAVFYQPGQEPWTHHERSLGVLVSTDAGQTWRQSSQGLVVGDIPYRHVQSLAISPTFGQDNTLFAFAWGPLESRPESFYRYLRSGLFRSRDRGASWEHISVPGTTLTYPRIAISTSYAEDGLMLLGADYPGMSPTSGQCAVYRTADGGDTWTKVLPASSESSCGPVFFLTGKGDQPTALLQRFVRGSVEWFASDDGGFTWRGLTVSADLLVPSPAFARDQTLFTTGDRAKGVLAIGGDVKTTDGHVQCPATAGPTFARPWQSSTSVQQLLGCPVEPERKVRLREQLAQDNRGGPIHRYWTEDDVPFWFELRADELAPNMKDVKTLIMWTKAKKPWPEGGYRTVDGVIQRFEGGYTLWLTKATEQRVVLVLPYGYSRGWSELPGQAVWTENGSLP